MKKALFSFLLSSILIVSGIFNIQAQSKTYSETRKLLVQMNRVHDYAILKKLFEEGEERKPNLIKSLYDSEQKVSLNAQIVLRYLSDDESLTGLEKWIEYRKKNNQDYWTVPIELLTKTEYLDGNEKVLTKLVLKELFDDQRDYSAKLVAFNNETQTALIEVIQGQIFTTGNHVVIRKENGKWRLLSNSLVWES